MKSTAEILNKTMRNHSSVEKITSQKVKDEFVEKEQDICPICNGMGYIINDVPPIHPMFGKAEPCDCKKEELAESQYDRLVTLSGLVGWLRDCSFGTFSLEGPGLDGLSKESLAKAFETAWSFAETPQGWLFLQGKYGCGKTHLAASIANFQVESGRSSLFVNTPDLLDHLRGTYASDAQVGYDERFEQVRSSPLLILDDFGTQQNTEWAKEKLYQILNYRYNSQLPTVITTNQDLEDIESRVRSRLIDRNLVKRIIISAPDYRRPYGEKDDSDLSSLEIFWDRVFRNFDIHSGTAKHHGNLERAYERAVTFANNPDGWLVFYSCGIHGNGKTHLAAAIANQIAQSGGSVLFVAVPELLDYLRGTFSKSSTSSFSKRFNEIRKARILVLDDLGTENATDWAKEKLHQILVYRYNAKLPTVITTAKNVEKEFDPKLRVLMLNGYFAPPFEIKAEEYYYKIPPTP